MTEYQPLTEMTVGLRWECPFDKKYGYVWRLKMADITLAVIRPYVGGLEVKMEIRHPSNRDDWRPRARTTTQTFARADLSGAKQWAEEELLIIVKSYSHSRSVS